MGEKTRPTGTGRRAGMPVALTVAGSDSSGGAGIQADLRVFAALQVYGTCAVTAVTAQNTVTLRDQRVLSGEFVRTQIGVVMDDFPVAACKTGMLGTADVVFQVAEALRTWRLRPVVDPVIASTSGTPLLDEPGIEALIEYLLPLARIVMPNVPEAERLCGRSIQTLGDQEAAARQLVDMGAAAALVKGGHLAGDPVDVLVYRDTVHRLLAHRIRTRHTHGTGCTYSAAVTANLAKGLSLVESVRLAHSYLQRAIGQAPGLGRGRGPVHHMVAWY